eukprot:TRINITY_DN9871_c0_g1_i1.p1 TRINITY_DN9871_c0_g1~~TRINITY_DN9871_c0_g1_i1.p1  ORF type:complete len:361 (-),score=88.02 TRINITY_DN9871_c0_g1_i1:15-1070(-)
MLTKLVIVGDQGVGKTSIVSTLLTKNFKNSVRDKIPSVLVPFYSISGNMEILDTSSSLLDQDEVDSEIRNGDVICVVFDLSNVDSLYSVQNWIERIRDINYSCGITLIGNKLDLVTSNKESERIESLLDNIEKSQEIDHVLLCSATSYESVEEAIWIAAKSSIYPTKNICVYTNRAQTITFTPQFETVAKNIFDQCDKDEDGILSIDELNDFCAFAFDSVLKEGAIKTIVKQIEKASASDVVEGGLSFEGFRSFFTLLLKKGRTETVWTVLKRFGYNENMEVKENFVPNVKSTKKRSLFSFSLSSLTSLMPEVKKSNLLIGSAIIIIFTTALGYFAEGTETLDEYTLPNEQ